MASIEETTGRERNDSLRGAVAVVTGASGGIGSLTAIKLARRGAQVAVSSRSEDQLKRVAAECIQAGGSAAVFPADVSKPDDVKRLAENVVDRYGRIDLWVNCAATALFSHFGEEPLSDYRRVLETNLFGCIHSARACIPQFRHQGGGTMINVVSVHSRLPAAYLSSYAVANAGIRSLAACLRSELQDVPEVRVCNLTAGATDTSLFRRAGNYTGQRLTTKVTVHTPEEVAQAIVECAENPKDEQTVSLPPRMALVGGTLASRLAERKAEKIVRAGFFTDMAAEPSSGNLFEPVTQIPRRYEGGTPTGGSRKVAIAASTAGVGILAGLLLWSRR